MSTAVGKLAEQEAAQFLQREGFTILQQNWRTRWCEIDVVAQKSGVIYFVEAKYRSSDRQGSGLDYITRKKLQQMHFAAEFWTASYKSSGDYRLGAIELTGDPPEVTEWIEDIS